ncbi:dethiobiotin synthase [Chitinophaga solisilvae]|uniref:ATP-dependent dethiobiotin synthetase BioD n=1 Tax=Chitinophaga solisilvae TaxID=1233460 RepID=A0A433WB23_9BACT|nr:dethiobiotin synthase [Chitinophaga solisilvae]NSL86728.1 dethiobiotin synthase [Chitinophaga solisilvae]
MNRIFITGIGTGVGKTVTAACVTAALEADYWKPVQSGMEEGTDTATIQALLAGTTTICHPEAYVLKEPASPHLAARMEHITIDTSRITAQADGITGNRPLIIEGAGGLLVPLNDEMSTLDLIRQLQARVIIVAQNYLGSINHSMLTAKVLQHTGVPVMGWIFTGHHHSNEDDVIRWSGYPSLGRIPQAGEVNSAFVMEQARLLTGPLNASLYDH